MSAQIPECMWLIECDSGYKNKALGVSVILKTNKREYKPKDFAVRGKGPVHGELSAIHKAFLHLKTMAGEKKKIIVRTDCMGAHKFLTNSWKPDLPYIVDICSKIKDVTTVYPSIIYEHVRTKDIRRVDRRAHGQRLEAEKQLTANFKKKLMLLDERVARAQDIQINMRNSESYAHSSDGTTKYKVSLSPMSCECRDWTKKWSNVPPVGKYKNRLPCKHICALALRQGIDVFGLWWLRDE